MKGRESGMPAQEAWEKFFEPAKILKTLGLNSQVIHAVEFGCGYGTFTIPAAKVVKGKVYAIDIEPEMIEATQQEARRQRLNNIETLLRDFILTGTGLESESVDYAMLFNILHIKNPKSLLQESCRILKPGGKLGIIHWNYDPATPRGPAMGIRPRPQDCLKWAESAGFTHPRQYDLKPYHYGIILVKTSS